MELYQLRTFYQVALNRSFSRAATAVSLTQPAVSRQIEALERELGITLFNRRGRQVELTEAGRRFHDYAERILSLADQAARAMNEIRDLREGRVTLAASTTPGNYLLPQLIARFRKRHPGIEVHMDVMPSREVARAVLEGRADVGILAGPVPSSALQVAPFQEDELVLIVPPGHPLAAMVEDSSVRGDADREHTRALLQQERLLLREPGSATRRAMENLLNELSLPADGTELGNTEAIKRAVGAGMGISFISRHAVLMELKLGLLSEASCPLLRIKRDLYFAHLKGLQPSPAVEAFCDFARHAGRDGDNGDAQPGEEVRNACPTPTPTGRTGANKSA